MKVSLQKTPAQRIEAASPLAIEAQRLLGLLQQQARSEAQRQMLATVARALAGLQDELMAGLREFGQLLDAMQADAGAPALVGAAAAGATGAEGVHGEPRPVPSGKPSAREPLPATEEQQAIVDAQEHDVVINAFAGTGKTATLIAYAAARPRRRILYLAFNRSIAEEAQARFGQNVKARTSHSLAFSRVGKDFNHKLGNPRARDVLLFLQEKEALPRIAPCDEYAFAQAALQRVRDFFADGSREAQIGDAAASVHHRMPSGELVGSQAVVLAARAVWEAMRDRGGSMPMPHDGYLKLYQLSAPDLSKIADIVMLDEAQDTTPAVLSIVQQQRIGKVVVGDRHQGIYGFRGALDAMSRMTQAREYALTTSFRFGPPIARVANLLLSIYCGERRRLVGAGGREPTGPRTLAQLWRTNAGLFGAAVAWLDARGAAGPGLHFVGGADAYQFELIADAWRLRCGETADIADPFVRKFSSLDALQDYALAVDDKELLTRIGIVERFGQRIPALVERVRAAHVAPEAAGLQLSTVHRAKGLEWDCVQLGDDFPDLLSEEGLPRTWRFLGRPASGDDAVLPKEEANIAYVAPTRARCELQPNPQLADFLEWCKRERERRDAAAQQQMLGMRNVKEPAE